MSTEIEPCPKDIPDIVELTESIEELELRLASCCEVLRGGNVGEAWEPLLPGSGGGAFRTAK